MPTQKNNPWAKGGQYHEDWSSKNNPALESPYANNGKEYSGEFENIGEEYKNEFANTGNEYQNLGAEYANEFSPTDTDVLDSRELFENDREVLNTKNLFSKNKEVLGFDDDSNLELNYVIGKSTDRRNKEDSTSSLSKDPNTIFAQKRLVNASNKELETEMEILLHFFTLNARTNMKEVAKSMFNTFTKRLAGINNYDYQNLHLNREIENHPKFKKFLIEFSLGFKKLLVDHKGNITKVLLLNEKIVIKNPPVFDDLFGGFKIILDAVNYTEVTINTGQTH